MAPFVGPASERVRLLDGHAKLTRPERDVV
jgi:hypothetical protein